MIMIKRRLKDVFLILEQNITVSKVKLTLNIPIFHSKKLIPIHLLGKALAPAENPLTLEYIKAEESSKEKTLQQPEYILEAIFYKKLHHRRLRNSASGRETVQVYLVRG